MKMPKWWSYKGRELNAPWVILARLVLFPVIFGLVALTTLLLYCCGDSYTAKNFWNDRP